MRTLLYVQYCYNVQHFELNSRVTAIHWRGSYSLFPWCYVVWTNQAQWFQAVCVCEGVLTLIMFACSKHTFTKSLIVIILASLLCNYIRIIYLHIVVCVCRRRKVHAIKLTKFKREWLISVISNSIISIWIKTLLLPSKDTVIFSFLSARTSFLIWKKIWIIFFTHHHSL